jgi:phage-related protein
VADWNATLPVARRRTVEVRSNLSGGRIGRVVFSIRQGDMYLLTGFIKKTQKTPPIEIELARKRLKEVME